MTTLRRYPFMKIFLLILSFTLALITLAACGGGGGATSTSPKVNTTATLKIAITGSLPPSTAISGAKFTITLPANVTPEITGADVSNGVVINSGTFANSTLAPQVVYKSETSKLDVILSSSVVSGITQVDEVATITLKLANRATPTATSFVISGESVVDASLYNSISGMGVIVKTVELN